MKSPARTASRIFAIVLAISFLLVLMPDLAEAQIVTDFTLEQGPYQGIHDGIYAQGSTLVSASGLELAYDFETFNATGDLVDFSGNNRNGTVVGSPAQIDMPFGEGTQTTGSTHYIQAPAFSQAPSGGLTFVTRFEWRANAAPTFGLMIQATSNSLMGRIGANHWGFEWRGSILESATTADFDYHIIVYRMIGAATTIWLDGVQIASGSTNGATDSFAWSIWANTDHDEFMIFSRAITDAEIGFLADGRNYTFRFTEASVPADITTGVHWVRGLNQSMAAVVNDTADELNVNNTLWLNGAFSWNSFMNDSQNVTFNFTMESSGTFPYWVNDTFQANLTTIADAIDFSWTDWIDGEHFFELGFEILSTPVTSATVGSPYSYTPIIAKTNVTWSLETAPAFLAIDSSSGFMAGVPLVSQVAVVTVRVTASGGLFREQTFAISILEVGVLSDAETMTLWLFVILMLVLFVVGPIFRFWFLWMLAGLFGVLLGLLAFDLLENFTLTISIMGLGGFLLVGGVLLTIAQGVEAGMTGRRHL